MQIAVSDQSRVRQVREERWAAQKQALCKQVLMQQDMISKLEEERDELKSSLERVQNQHAVASAQAKEQSESVQTLTTVNGGLKDDLLAARAKLEELSEWRLQRERTMRQDEERREMMAKRDAEVDDLRQQLQASRRSLKEEQQQHADTQRLLQQEQQALHCQTAYAEELMKGQQKMKKSRDRRDDAARVAEKQGNSLRQQVERLTREVHERDKRLREACIEGQRLRRERVDLRQDILDKEVAAKEREVIIRDVMQQNQNLSATLAQIERATLDRQRDVVEEVQHVHPVGIVEVDGHSGVGAALSAPGALTSNLREHNKLLLARLTNLLQQQNAMQRGFEQQLNNRIATRGARTAPLQAP